MESYESLLNKAYSEVKVVSSSTNRFVIPKAEGHISGKSTIVTNLPVISSVIRRPIEHIAKFLQKELATPGKLDKDRLILHTKLNSNKINEKMELYVKEFVLCPVCGKPDTEVMAEKGIKSRHCLACGAKSPIKYNA